MCFIQLGRLKMPINKIAVQIRREKYSPENTTAKVDTIVEEELKSSDIGIKRKTTGQTTRKNNSSRNKFTNMMVVLLPALMPSFTKKITTRLDPPTAGGVTAVVNSLNTLI